MRYDYKKILKQREVIKTLSNEKEELQKKYDNLLAEYNFLKDEKNNSYEISQDMIKEMKQLKQKYESSISEVMELKQKLKSLIEKTISLEKNRKKYVKKFIKQIKE